MADLLRLLSWAESLNSHEIDLYYGIRSFHAETQQPAVLQSEMTEMRAWATPPHWGHWISAAGLDLNFSFFP